MDGLPPGGLGGLEALLGGGAGGPGGAGPGLAGLLGPGLWDMPMIQMIAFHPRPAEPDKLGATSGPIRDGTFDVPGGDTVSYRLYMPPEEQEVQVVVYNFHGNAEICTDIGMCAELFHGFGAALLSVDYRGFAWGTGQPGLSKLCDDAEACWQASQQVLEAAGCEKAKRVLMGRSIGATCAVHLATTEAADIHGLIVDSGLMSVKQLPMVSMMAPQVLGPQAAQLFPALPEPFDTIGKLAKISCPTLVMHGDMDEIVPMSQGVLCHDRCASQEKKLVKWPGAGHNNVNLMYGNEWGNEIAALIGQAKDFENATPTGALVEAHSLSVAELNGAQGRVLGPQGDRIRVSFPDPHGEKALKPANIKVLERQKKRLTEEFPIGSMVEAHSLSVAELNGVQGKVLKLQGDRVRVAFPEPHGEKALKPANLKAVE